MNRSEVLRLPQFLHWRGGQVLVEADAVVPVAEQIAVDEDDPLACPEVAALLGEAPSGGIVRPGDRGSANQVGQENWRDFNGSSSPTSAACIKGARPG